MLQALPIEDADSFYAVAVGAISASTGIYKSWAVCGPHVIGVPRAKYGKFASVEAAKRFLEANGVDQSRQVLISSDITPVGEDVKEEQVECYAVVYPENQANEIWWNWAQCRAAIKGRAAIHQKCESANQGRRFIDQVIAELRKIEAQSPNIKIKTTTGATSQQVRVQQKITRGEDHRQQVSVLYPLIQLGEEVQQLKITKNQKQPNITLTPMNQATVLSEKFDFILPETNPRTADDKMNGPLFGPGGAVPSEEGNKSGQQMNVGYEVEGPELCVEKAEASAMDLEEKIKKCKEAQEKLVVEIRRVMAEAKWLKHPARHKAYWKFVL